MTEEEARRLGYRAPPPPPPPAVAPAPMTPPTVRRVAPVAAPPPPPAPGTAEDGTTLGVTATTQFETPQQREARELQLRAANEAIATIEGRTPSVAALQMQRGLNQATARQQSQAAGARGMGVAAARRMSARNIAELQQGAVGQAAELRAQEVAGARAQLADIAGQVRSQDIDTTEKGANAIERAKRNANDYEVAMADLDLREKLGLLSDERERAHLEEMRRHNKEIERLQQAGLTAEAEAVRNAAREKNKAFWGSLLTGAGTVIGAVVGGPAGAAVGAGIGGAAGGAVTNGG